ncbi:hypothetical protein V1L54_27190, partial [Streptomyces sp. TRM 70361]|uniref:hypothetical protein n=1 Tax=Streptomyces sp. TRM 70361 TaxID=3116553 RepID=UPI002E7C1E8C
APLDHPGAVAWLLDALRKAGAEEQVAALAERAAAHAPLDHPYAVARLLDALRKAEADEQVGALVARFPAAGHFAQFVEVSDHRDRFRFGREPNEDAAPAWAWDDLV